MDETEVVNLGDEETLQETRVSTHLEVERKQELIELFKQYADVFAWSYDNIPGLRTHIISYKLPIDPTCPPVKQKTRKFKSNISLRIKEEVTKRIAENIVRVSNYPTWLANIVFGTKKNGNIRIRVDYQDINSASPKNYCPLPNTQILIDNCAKYDLQSFDDRFADITKS